MFKKWYSELIILYIKHTVSLKIQFNSNFVGDTFEWNEIGKPKKGYKITKGKDIKIVELTNTNKRL